MLPKECAKYVYSGQIDGTIPDPIVKQICHCCANDNDSAEHLSVKRVQAHKSEFFAFHCKNELEMSVWVVVSSNVYCAT